MNLNPIDFNYIDGENIYPIQEYIDNITIDTNTIISNNSVYSSNYTNALRIDINKLINEQNENILLPSPTTLKHTYITNSNLAGEIRFWLASTPISFPNIPIYRTKIDLDGKLKIYYIFDPLINLTWGSGWLDIAVQIVSLQAATANLNIAITGVEAQVQFNYNVLQEQIYSLTLGLEEELLIDTATRARLDTELNNIRTSYTVNEGTQALNVLWTDIRQLNFTRILSTIPRVQNYISYRVSQNAYIGFALGIGGTVFGLWYGMYVSQQEQNLANSLVNQQISSNNNLTSNQKRILYDSNFSNIANNIIDQAYSNLEINLAQGFINSNIITSQFIPSLNTNAITYQGVEISNTLNNYLLKAGGTMTGRVNFNYGTNVFGNPVAGGGGNGERLNLNTNGITGIDFPPSIGVSSNSLWNSVPNNHRFQWFNNGNQIMSLSSNGILNVPSILENNLTLSNISQTTILNSTPNVQKKYMFTGTCSSSILMPDGITYYAYDIDIRNYTQLKYAPNPNTPYRIFNIKIFFGSVYFGFLTNGRPNVLSYEVYMSNESQAGGGGIGSAGLNVCAIGYPENVILNTISPTQLSLVCGDFNFITVLSRVNGTVFNAVIEDVLF
jgi:hypothetical protein